MKKLPLLFTGAILSTCLCVNAQSWKLVGNAGTNPTTNFVGTTDGKPLVFRTNNVEQVRIEKTGKVGIGTNNPASRLQIINPGQVSLTNPGYFILGDVANYNLAFDNYTIQSRYNGIASDLYLNTSGGVVWAGYGYKSIYGLVGYGKYEGLYGVSYDSLGIGTYGYSSSYYGIYGYTGASNGGGSDPNGISGVYGYNAATGYGVGGHCVGGSGVYGYSDNYVGVWGSTGNSSYYAGYFQGNVYTTGSYLPSDAKLKKNIKDVSSAMNILNQLHPKEYEYRDDGNYKLMNLPKGNRFGLIADDVEKVLPNLVKASEFNTKDMQPGGPVDPKDRSTSKSEIKNEKIDFKALNYTELIPIIIKGMQEQESVIKQQQQQIDQLKDLVQTLANNQSSISTTSLPKTGAYLLQNSPNPFNQTTTIRCYVPSSVKQAQLNIYNAAGKTIKSFSLNNTGMNEVTLTAGSLTSGQYKYALIIDGKQIESKSMALTN